MSTTDEGTTISNDVDVSNPMLTEEDAQGSFLKTWDDDAKKLSETEEEETTETEEETDSSEEEVEENEETETEETEEVQEEPESSNEETETEQIEVSEEAQISVQVGDEEHSVQIKDLKRLYGQEKSLTHKSQALADQRKAVDAEGAKYVAGLEQLMKRAEERLKPYKEVDMLVASRNMPDNEFQQLRREFNTANEDFNFLKKELDGFVKDFQEKQQTEMKQQAQESVKVLKQEIPKWDNNLYGKLRDHAVEMGFSKEMVDNTIDPSFFKLVYQSKLYSDGKAKVKLKPKIKKATKVVSPKKGITGTELKRATDAKKLEKLQQSGSQDDAMDAFLQSWQSN